MDLFNRVNPDALVAYLYPAATALLRITLILFFVFMATAAVKRLADGLQTRILRTMTKRSEAPQEVEKRARTLGGIISKTLIVALWIVAAVMALREIGFDVAPILAGAGVVGLAVGFGAQNLVRDVISGMFMLLENQLRIGDVVELNGKGGLVEEINLRTTVLRGLDGALHVFPNGAITTLSNLTHEFSYYVFDIGVDYSEDTDRVATEMRAVAEDLQREDAYRVAILDPLEVLGVEKFADSAVVVRARIKTLPGKQWMVGRELNRRFKQRFDEAGIQIPFPHMSLELKEGAIAEMLSTMQKDTQVSKPA